MTTNATTAEDRLARLGIQLPDAPTPFGAYVPAVQTGNLLFLSGMLATAGHDYLPALFADGISRVRRLPIQGVAPITTLSPSLRTNAKSGMRAMSIRCRGRASRIAISGTRVCPPAMMRASSCSASKSQASSRLWGRT